MHVDHLAIAVRSIEQAADRLCHLLGYAKRTEKVTNTRHKVNVLFLEKPGSMDLKLIEPSDAESLLWDFVKKGGGLHHVCFKVPDVQGAVAELAQQGVRILSQPMPGEAFDDNLIAFCYLGFGVNAELIDTDARRAVIAASSSSS
jgi:methylmalonyl-CoA/ethylmalonyl-CoA epimerase